MTLPAAGSGPSATEVPYVVTVASEKGGVGKTTIATNLAVYLKALHEDLPVTIASFDNHFSVDSMFAIGGHRGTSVAGLFAGSPPEALATLGEYGVSFLASARGLAPPDGDPERLRRTLADSRLGGILVLDTRPLLDTLTRNALRAADLVLVPVKDRASLVNAAAIRSELVGTPGGEERLWLVPSLIDGRLRLREDLGMLEFLVLAARERGYQVLETGIAKSPKVEGLATNLTTRTYPVLTHARGTRVHGQFRALAEFVFGRVAALPGPLAAGPVETADGRPGNLQPRCPACGCGRPERGHFVMTLRRRRRGVLHAGCLEDLLGGLEAEDAPPADGLLAAYCGEGEEDEVRLLVFRGVPGEEHFWELPAPLDGGRWRGLAAALAGVGPGQLYRECLLVFLPGVPLPGADGNGGRFFDLRRRVLEWLAATVR